jgi:sterol 14alpha-demethylase
VAASPAFAHRLPTVFSQPDAFQPERYAPPREEDKVKPFSYIGFGGGRHGCLGQNFAYLQVKVRADSQPLPSAVPKCSTVIDAVKCG